MQILVDLFLEIVKISLVAVFGRDDCEGDFGRKVVKLRKDHPSCPFWSIQTAILTGLASVNSRELSFSNTAWVSTFS